MFFILDGEGELRFGDKRYPLRRHDIIACPPGGPEVAHQIINTGADHALSGALDAVRHRGLRISGLGQDAGRRRQAGRTGCLRKIFRAESTVDYYDREEN